MQFDTLYAKASTDKIKQWRVWTEGNLLYTEHGYLNGALQCPAPKIIKGKNVGRSNETHASEQAVKEAKARHQRQLEKGYVPDFADIEKKDEVELFKPMLAKNVTDQKHNVIYPCDVQPKLDGVRCLARKKNGRVTLWSRSGKLHDVNILKELVIDLESVLTEGQVTDGELFHPEWNFQRITRAYKKRRNETTNEYGKTADLQYWIYDAPSGKQWNGQSGSARYNELLSIKETCRVKHVRAIRVHSWNEVLTFEQEYLNCGFEGLMIRNLNGLYKYDGRSSDLLKVKQFKDEEFKIVGGKEAIGDDAGTVVFLCETSEGKEFSVRPMGTRETRAEYWENLTHYIGKQLTVKFFEKSNDNVPRFPVGIAIRDYE